MKDEREHYCEDPYGTKLWIENFAGISKVYIENDHFTMSVDFDTIYDMLLGSTQEELSE